MKLKMIVGAPGAKPIIIYDEETGKLLFYSVTYSKKVKPGIYTRPKDIVEILRMVASRGHGDSADYDPNIVFKFLVPLLFSDAPLKEKSEQILRFLRSATKE